MAPAGAASPDFRPQLRRPPHRRGFLDAERVVKLLQVHVRADGAELAGGVRVNRDAPAQLGFAPVGVPELRQRQEKPLLRREAIDLIRLEGSLASARSRASYPMLAPPRSAMFSPRVRRPFTL